ncbi:MAG TPA: ABC transporter ATP-binding protein [Armatimonadota bacterium]|nr:ABC transporter ATP-binding protein [Armatimonadota bacterium]
MLVMDTPPPVVEGALDFTSERFLFACQSEISEEGQYSEQWLVVTDRAIYHVAASGLIGTVAARIPLGEAREARIRIGSGSGHLVLELAGGASERFMRFATGETRYFGKASGMLNAVLRGEPIRRSDVDARELGLCAKCGQPLLAGANICPRCFRGSRVLWRLLRSTRPYALALTIISLISLVSTAMSLAPPYLTKILIDQVFGKRRFNILGEIVAALAGIQVVSMGLGMWAGRLRVFLANRLAFDGRNNVLSALQRLPLAFFERHQIGVITSRVIKDSDAVFDFWVEQSDQIVENVLLVLGVGGMLFFMNWRLALLVLIPFPFILGTATLIRRKLEWRWGRLWDKWNSLYGTIGDSLSGIRVVKAFAQERLQTKMLKNHSREVYLADVETHGLWNVYMPFLQFLIGAGALLVWFVGGNLVERGETTLGVLIAFISYMAMFYTPIRQMSRLADTLPRTLTAIERVFDLVDSAPETYEPENAVAMADPRGEVELRHVTFGYEPHHPVLRDINLRVRPGESIGLVGHSGAGKSTLVKLLGRFYTVTEGQILLDGVDIRQIPLGDLRAHIGYVEQDPFLFSGTIASNISFSRPDASREEIVAASMAANAHEFIVRLPDGYDTQVGERGQRLSGGERQRLSIARAILHNPRILILDEPTSAVDLQTERKIQSALARLSEGRTTFAIAHRLSTLRNCDRLVVLDRGRQVEVGSHDELAAKDGAYANLVRIHSDVSRLVAVSS